MTSARGARRARSIHATRRRVGPGHLHDCPCASTCSFATTDMRTDIGSTIAPPISTTSSSASGTRCRQTTRAVLDVSSTSYGSPARLGPNAGLVRPFGTTSVLLRAGTARIGRTATEPPPWSQTCGMPSDSVGDLRRLRGHQVGPTFRSLRPPRGQGSSGIGSDPSPAPAAGPAGGSAATVLPHWLADSAQSWQGVARPVWRAQPAKVLVDGILAAQAVGS